MGRSNTLSAQVFIDTGAELIPYLEIDRDGSVTMLVSDKEQQQYEQKMLKRMGESMSRFYTEHPEDRKKEKEYEESQRTV